MKIVLVGPGADGGASGQTEVTAAALHMLAESGVAEVTLIAQDPDAVHSHFGLPAVPRVFGADASLGDDERTVHLRKVIDSARGRITDIDIDDPIFDLINAIAGAKALVITTDVIPGSLRPSALYEYAALSELAKLFSRPVFLSAQVIDTALTELHRELLAETLNRCALVGIASGPSRAFAQTLLQDKSRLRHTVEDAIVLDDHAPAERPSTPYCAVAIDPPHDATEAGIAADDLARLLDHVIAETDLDVVLVPGRPSGTTAEQRAADNRWRTRVASRLTAGGRASAAPSRGGVTDTARIVRNASVAISTEALPLAYAVSGAVPAIGIYDDLPTREHMTAILGAAGQAKYALPAVSVSSGHAALAFDRLWKTRSAVAKTLARQNAPLARVSHAWWADVAAILNDEKRPAIVTATPPAEEPFPPALADALAALTARQHHTSEAATTRELDLQALQNRAEADASEALQLERKLAESQATVSELEYRLTVSAAALKAGQELASRMAEPLFSNELRPPAAPLAQGELEAQIQALTNTRTFRWTRRARGAYGKLRRAAGRVLRRLGLRRR